MELHNKFEYQGGEILWLAADDEAWVYINEKLALDMGGMHGEIPRILSLDTLGLTKGQTYNFDLFFGDRLFCVVLEMATNIDFIDKSVGRRAMRTIPTSQPAPAAKVPLQEIRFALGKCSTMLRIPQHCTLRGVELYNSSGSRIRYDEAGVNRHGELSLTHVYFLKPVYSDAGRQVHTGSTVKLVPIR
jgi:fibro-slime domain-containing protein